MATKCSIQSGNFYKRAFLEGYKNISALGLDEAVIERLFGTGDGYFAKTYEFDEGLQKSYQEAMDKLQAMMSRYMLVKALGYEYEEEKITYCKNGAMRNKENKEGGERLAYQPQKKVRNGKWIEYRKEVFKKHQPGSDQLFIFFMTNKFPDKWKVSRELLTGKAEGYDSKPSQRIRKVIESLGRDVLAENTDRPETKHSVSDGLAPISDGSDKDGKE